MKTHVTLVHADRNTPGFMRSPPVVPYIYALESAMDELAVKLDMDPVELRRINDSMTDATGKPWSSRSLMKCYDQAAERVRLEQARPQARLDARRRLADRLGLRQRGLSDPCRRRRPRACGCSPNGEARVQIAAHEIGTGVTTVVGADGGRTARHPARRTSRSRLGDSTLPPSPVAGGSNQTASCCSAVMKACDAIMAKLDAAGDNRQRRPARRSRWKTSSSGSASARSRNMPNSCRRGGKARDTDQEALRRHAVPRSAARKGEKLMYALGAEFVEVRVHALTREIRVPRMVGAFAAGRIMNTRTARSQYHGRDDLGRVVGAA